jgi:hypothetical protein
VVGDVLAGQATEAAGGKPYLGWAVSEWLYEERDRMWRDRHLGGLYETVTSPWQLRLKENSGTADALGRLTPEQLDALLDQGMDAYARHQGRTFKAMNELEAGLTDQLHQLPWTHTGADIEAAVRAKVAEAVNAAMGPAADVGLIDRIATAVDARLSQWLSNGIDETTVTRITEAVGPVLAANADTLGDRARQFLDDLTGAMADEIAKAYDATMAQQFADELGVPVIGGRQNVVFMRDGSAWGVAGFKEPWKYGMRRFLPKGSVQPDVPGVVGPLPPLLEGDALAQAVAAGQDDGWLNWLRRLVHWPEAGPPPAAAIPAPIAIPTHPDVLERARNAWANADQAVHEHQSIRLPDGPGLFERYQDYKLETDRLELARIWARADVVRAYQAAGLAVPPEGRVLTAVADLHTAMARYRARYAEFADQPPLAYLDDPQIQALNAAEGAAGAELRAAQQACTTPSSSRSTRPWRRGCGRGRRPAHRCPASRSCTSTTASWTRPTTSTRSRPACATWSRPRWPGPRPTAWPSGRPSGPCGC